MIQTLYTLRNIQLNLNDCKGHRGHSHARPENKNRWVKVGPTLSRQDRHRTKVG